MKTWNKDHAIPISPLAQSADTTLFPLIIKMCEGILAVRSFNFS